MKGRTIFKAPPREVRSGDRWRRPKDHVFKPFWGGEDLLLQTLRREYLMADGEERELFEVEIAREEAKV